MRRDLVDICDAVVVCVFGVILGARGADGPSLGDDDLEARVEGRTTGQAKGLDRRDGGGEGAAEEAERRTKGLLDNWVGGSEEIAAAVYEAGQSCEKVQCEKDEGAMER